MTSMCLVNESGETRKQAFTKRYGDGFPSPSALMDTKKNNTPPEMIMHVSTENASTHSYHFKYLLLFEALSQNKSL